MSDQGNEQFREAGGAKSDATGEFFSVGQPLHAVRAGYIKRRADEVLFDTVSAGRFAHVIAPERSGKSSLVAATTVRLEASGRKVAVLDLQQIGVRDGGGDAGRWYYSVAYRLLRQLRIRFDLQSWWQDKAILSNRQRLVEFYSEVILGNVSDPIVVFIDEIQCVGELPFADQLLASIRAAHNARTTDPDFSRLTFVLLGECDPNAMVEHAETSPFHVTQSVALPDFTREEIALFGTELGLQRADATRALDRIYYWTSGQPYLTQKLARAVAREGAGDDVDEQVDRLVVQQLSGRNVTLNEKHMSHIHRCIVGHRQHASALLNLYGRIRKGIEVAADLGSPLQRYLIATGLVVINDERCLEPRNRIYAAVFTARWANENLPAQWRGPALAVVLVLVMLAIPFWYTQLLPRGYVDVLTSPTIDLQYAESAYTNFRSFPGHAAAADSLYRNMLQERAQVASSEEEITEIATLASDLPEVGRLPEELTAAFWERQARAAMRDERRDDALLATLESLVLATPQRRQLAASLIADDYPLLLQSLRAEPGGRTVFDAENMILTRADGAMMSQWAYDPQGTTRGNDWKVTALEVTPVVRRVIVDSEGTVRRIGLTLRISHPRLGDLRIKVIAPSGRTVEVETGLERSVSNEEIRVDPAQLRELIGESINGTWSLSVRDEALGVAGHLVGWNLKLNSQGVVEDLERGFNIPDPVERETDNIWFSDDGRYVVARAMQSDSARIWDLAFAKPIRAIAVGENEQLVGLDAGARRLVTATQDSIHLWDTTTGDRVAILEVGAASQSARITGDGYHLFVQQRSDVETAMEVWSMEAAERTAAVTVAGTPALVAVSDDAARVAVADYDRAVRVWDTESGELVAQIGLAAQPSALRLAPGGDALGVVYGEEGISLWRIDEAAAPLFEILDAGRWQLTFSPSGSSVVAGNPARGYQVYRSEDGRLFGPALGPSSEDASSLLAFSSDEQTVVTGGDDGSLRFWRVPVAPAIVETSAQRVERTIWSASGEGTFAVAPDARYIAIGDRDGGVHVLPADGGVEALAALVEEVSFLGHKEEVRLLRMNRDGTLVASVATDNTVRVWNVIGGDPRPFSADIPGNAITHVQFSTDSTLLAVLNGTRAEIVDAASGDIVAGFELGDSHGALAFADNNNVYLGSENGALRNIQRDAGGGWSMQTVWQGEAALRSLEASPRGDYLVVVDADNRASQFNLTDGQPGALTMTLPAPISEVRFSPGGSRVIFRTSRWVHRAGSSSTGLHWLDSAYGPAALPGARVVFGENPDAHGSQAWIPVAHAGFMRLAELRFGAADTAGLFGRRDELLAEWTGKLGRPTAD